MAKKDHLEDLRVLESNLDASLDRVRRDLSPFRGRLADLTDPDVALPNGEEATALATHLKERLDLLDAALEPHDHAADAPAKAAPAVAEGDEKTPRKPLVGS